MSAAALAATVGAAVVVKIEAASVHNRLLALVAEPQSSSVTALGKKVVDRAPVVRGCMAVLVGSCPLVAVVAVTGFSALATVRVAGCCLSHRAATGQCR